MPHPPTLPQPRPNPLPLPARPPAPRPLPAADRRPARRVRSGRAALAPAAAVCADVARDGRGGEFAASRERILRFLEGPRRGRGQRVEPPARPETPTAAGPSRRPNARPAVVTEEREFPDGRCFGAAVERRRRPRAAWRVEVFLVETTDCTRLSATLLTGRAAHTAAAPEVVRRLADSPGLTDYGWRLRATPWVVQDAESVAGLIDLISDPERTRPVFLTGLEIGETDPETAAIDVADLAWRTVGLAHVAVLTGPMTFVLSDRVGRRFSVFGNAVRTYHPGCVFGEREERHPMALAETLSGWKGGSREFVNFLTREAADASISRQAPEAGRLSEPLRPVLLAADSARERVSDSAPAGAPDDVVARALREPTADGDALHPLGVGVDLPPAEESAESEPPAAAARAG